MWARHIDRSHRRDVLHSWRIAARVGNDRAPSPAGRMLRVIALVAATACAGGSPPAPPPSPASAGPLPAMFDMGAVPDRPRLSWPNRTRTVIRRDSVAGKYFVVTVHDTVPGDSVPPDTNDSRVYYSAGVAARGLDPSLASADFYWASRLDPGWADPYFARWYTLRRGPYILAFRLVSRRGTVAGHSGGAAADRPADSRRPRVIPDSIWLRVDSLFLQASVRNPFVDEHLLFSDIVSQIRGQVMLANSLQSRMIDQINTRRLEEGEAPVSGPRRVEVRETWFTAYAARDFASAARLLAPLIKKNRDNLELYVYRANAFFNIRQYDSCSAMLRAAMARIETKEAARTLPAYLSKEVFAYAIGIAQEQGGNQPAARAAYEQTVSENLGFYMAHLHIASAALNARDTAAAVTEALAATQIRPDDPVVQFYTGYTLLAAGKHADAIEHLRAAIASDPYYALPYLYLGQALEQSHDTTEAVASYREFLARSRRDDDRRPTVESAVAILSGGLGSSTP
jgi:tetratricopeptide (TPR) repeat protein